VICACFGVGGTVAAARELSEHLKFSTFLLDFGGGCRWRVVRTTQSEHFRDGGGRGWDLGNGQSCHGRMVVAAKEHQNPRVGRLVC